MYKVIKIVLFFLILICGISCNRNNPSVEREIVNIQAYAKLYGYARWFHPSKESVNLDWNEFAVYGIAKVRKSKNDYELEKNLIDLFAPIAPNIQIIGPSKLYSKKQSTDYKNNRRCSVAWQHLGVELKQKRQLYRSERSGDCMETNNKPYFSYLIQLKNFKERNLEVIVILDGSFHSSSSFSFNANNDDSIIKTATSNLNIISKLQLKVPVNTKYLTLTWHLTPTDTINIRSIQLYENNKKIEDIDLVRLSLATPFNYLSNKTNVTFKRNMIKVLARHNLFDDFPSVNDTIFDSLSKNILCKVPICTYDVNNVYDTLPLTKIPSYHRITDFDNNLALADVVIAWNIMLHFYPNFNKFELSEWNKHLPKTLADVYSCQSKEDYYSVLFKFIEKLNDGHAYVFAPNIEIYSIPFKVVLINNLLVVEHSLDNRLMVGDVISNIDGISALTLFNESCNLISGSKQLKQYRALNIIGNKFSESIAKIEIIRNGKRINISIPRIKDFNKDMFFNRHVLRQDSFTRYDDILYVNLSNIGQEAVPRLINDLDKEKKIIFDYRFGSHIDMLPVINLLSDRILSSPIWCIPKVIYPNQRKMKFEESQWSLGLTKCHFKGKIIFLINPSVISYEETIMSIVDYYNLAETVGEQTAGCNGNTNYIDLPSGWQIRWTGLKVLKQNRENYHLSGIKPTYLIRRTFEGIVANKDEQLEYAINLLKEEAENP